MKPTKEQETSKPILRAMIFSALPLSESNDWMWAFIPADCKSIRVALSVAKPELAALSLQKVQDPEMSKDLLDFETKMLANSTKIKIGVLYIEKDQVDDENKMFSNCILFLFFIYFLIIFQSENWTIFRIFS